jgi:dTDP-4-dehydrorhamnose reductase
MKIIILGANGMMGSMLSFYCKRNNIDSISFSRNDFNVLTDSVEKFDRLLDPSGCYAVVNCIGCIPQKNYSETDYLTINQAFPHKLAAYCRGRGYTLVHLSTDCVYSGKYDYRKETDEPDSTTVYGITKHLGEPNYGTVIRCSIMGPEKETGFGLFSWFLRNPNPSVNGYVNHIWNGLTTWELADYICSNLLANSLPEGLIHLCSKNALSKYTILCELQKRSQKQIQIIPFENETKYYLLSSIHTQPRKSIEEQLDDLFQVISEFNN